MAGEKWNFRIEEIDPVAQKRQRRLDAMDRNETPSPPTYSIPFNPYGRTKQGWEKLLSRPPGE